jgi:hypothetical protein
MVCKLSSYDPDMYLSMNCLDMKQVERSSSPKAGVVRNQHP